jgi:L-lactate dehydrogenase complex protein LldG
MTLLPDEQAKKEFLQRVRSALGRTEPLRHMPDHPSLKMELPQQEQKVRTIQAKNEARRERLITGLLTRAEELGWRVNRVAGPEEAAQAVAEIARDAGAKKAARSAQDIFKRVDVDGFLRKVGINPLVLASGRTRHRNQLKPLSFDAEVGITGVDYAIAETGSCVVIPRKGLSRMVSLAPPVYIALVEPEQVVESLDDVFAMRRMEYLQNKGRDANYMNFISGPSRTADIEMTISIGVHGPGQVHLIMIG